jgi:hypothetical protein
MYVMKSLKVWSHTQDRSTMFAKAHSLKEKLGDKTRPALSRKAGRFRAK